MSSIDSADSDLEARLARVVVWVFAVLFPLFISVFVVVLHPMMIGVLGWLAVMSFRLLVPDVSEFVGSARTRAWVGFTRGLTIPLGVGAVLAAGLAWVAVASAMRAPEPVAILSSGGLLMALSPTAFVVVIGAVLYGLRRFDRATKNVRVSDDVRYLGRFAFKMGFLFATALAVSPFWGI
ncbi:MAG: hypothetical protein AAF196_19340 [Planctomycetota bacterium]